MAHAFRADPERQAIVGIMEPVEIDLVLDVMMQTRDLLGEPPPVEASELTEADLFAALIASMEEKEAPSDPVLRRLLPDGHVGDGDEASEFRRLTEDSIRRQKQAHLDEAIAAFTELRAGVGDDSEDVEIVLARPQARATMLALTDVRLVLAEQLDIRTDEDAEALNDHVEGLRIPESARDLTAMYYDFITWLSETLTVAYMGPSAG